MFCFGPTYNLLWIMFHLCLVGMCLLILLHEIFYIWSYRCNYSVVLCKHVIFFLAFCLNNLLSRVTRSSTIVIFVCLFSKLFFTYVDIFICSKTQELRASIQMEESCLPHTSFIQGKRAVGNDGGVVARMQVAQG